MRDSTTLSFHSGQIGGTLLMLHNTYYLHMMKLLMPSTFFPLKVIFQGAYFLSANPERNKEVPRVISLLRKARDNESGVTRFVSRIRGIGRPAIHGFCRHFPHPWGSSNKRPLSLSREVKALKNTGINAKRQTIKK